MLRKAVPAVLAVLGIPLIGAGQAEPVPGERSGHGWRYESIDLRVELTPEARRMRVEGTAVLRLEVETSLGPTLLLRQNDGESERSNVRFESLRASVGEVEVLNGPGPLPGVVISSVGATRPFLRGETIEVEFVVVGEGVRNQFVVHPEYATASWTSGWYPVPQPGPGEAFGSGIMSTSGRIQFDMPVAWRAVSVGDLASREEVDGRAIEEWAVDDPRALGFAAGPFASSIVEIGPRSVGMFRLTADPSTLPAQARALGKVIEAMAARFGDYPYSRFSIAEAPDQVPGFWAASEQGFILAKPGVFAAEDGNVPLFAHEAAHAWWGNLVGTEGAGSIFLTESLAQYGAAIAIESIEGEEAATSFLRFSMPEYIPNQSARGYFAVIRDGNDRAIASIEEGGGINHLIADSKGHWIHHMLRRRVGDELYFATLRSLKDQYAGGNLTLEEFRRTFVASAPRARLERFFEQWLDRTGAPVLSLDWTRAGPDSIDVTIVQEQSGLPYELDLDIELSYGGTARLETVTITEREQSVRLPSPVGTDAVGLDPHHRVLRWTPEYGPKPQDSDTPPEASPLVDLTTVNGNVSLAAN